jgi:hypothetical protein
VRSCAPDGIVDQRFQRRDAALVGHRAHVHASFQAIADLQLLGIGDELVDEGIEDALLHQEAGRRDAHLAGIAELGRGQGLGGQVHIHVIEHHGRRVAAQFHRGALHVLAGQRRQLLAHRVEPVKEILRITGCGIRYSEISAGTP